MRILNLEESQRKEIKQWIETWKKAESALDRIRLKELQADDYYSRNQVFLNEMLQYAFEHRKIRLSSGLVEQQKIFIKLKSNVLNTCQVLKGQST